MRFIIFYLEKSINEVKMEKKEHLENSTDTSDKFIFAKSSTEDFVNHINSCHEDEVLTVSELESYKRNQFMMKSYGSVYMIRKMML